MEHRTYHREELDTSDEILSEFQKLRDETAKEVNILTERIEALEKKKKK